MSAATGRAGWDRAPERSNALALRVMAWIALRCGRPVARGVLHLIALYFVCFAPGPRRCSARYLSRVFGRPARWIEVYRHVHRFAATILDRVYFLRGHTDWLELEVNGVDALDGVLDAGRGAFLVGAHLGSFEVLRAAAALVRPELRIAMVMYPDNARMINAALRAVAPDAVPDIIALGRPEAMLAIRDRLEEGGLIGVLADRSLPAESERGQLVRLPFLGRDAVFSDGPFRLAALLRQKMVFMVGLHHGGPHYDVRLELLADFSTRPTDAAERERRVREAIAAYVARLEALCRESPYNWFNFHDFWREDA